MNGIVAKSIMWNLWHGCHKLSAGCKHCYVYRGDARREVDSSVVVRTKNFDLPLRKKRNRILPLQLSVQSIRQQHKYLNLSFPAAVHRLLSYAL